MLSIQRGLPLRGGWWWSRIYFWGDKTILELYVVVVPLVVNVVKGTFSCALKCYNGEVVFYAFYHNIKKESHARILPLVGPRPPPSKAALPQSGFSADEACYPETAWCLCTTSFSLSRTFCMASRKVLVTLEVALAQR